jgi:protein-tyrosine phosphatase
VHRSVRLDLRRAAALGVRCVVVCLDDEELAMLGAPWEEYRREAGALGLDVVRMPMPEGGTPPPASVMDLAKAEDGHRHGHGYVDMESERTPENLEGVARMRAEVDKLIADYTRQGKDILVHCRGGLGRAGLVAACWMLALGVLGPVPRAHTRARASKPRDVAEPLGPKVDGQGRMTVTVERASLLMVERAIGVLRRRRSTKALETAEQAVFLLRFVEELRRG